MSAPYEDIARRVAARLAPEIGDALPMYVERAIALRDAAGEEPHQQFADPHIVIAAAGVILAATKTAWDMYWKLAEERNRRRVALPAPEERAPQAAAAQTPTSEREMLAAHLRLNVYFPDDFSQRQREQIIEDTVEEMLAGGAKHEAER